SRNALGPARPTWGAWSFRSSLGEGLRRRGLGVEPRVVEDERDVRGLDRVLAVGHPRSQRLAEDDPVESGRAVLGVVEVVAQLPGRAEVRARVAAAHLRPAGDARLQEVAARVERDPALEPVDELRLLGARPDDAHLAADHVDELRQLVEVRAA